MEIIIKSDEGYGPDAMSNVVCIPDTIFKNGKDGDKVKFSGEGVLIDHGDGSRYISVDTVEGQPVEEHQGDMGMDPQAMGDMNAADALSNYMQNKGK